MNPESEPVSLDEVADFAAEVRTWLEVHRASGALNPTAPGPQMADVAARTHAVAPTSKPVVRSSFVRAPASDPRPAKGRGGGPSARPQEPTSGSSSQAAPPGAQRPAPVRAGSSLTAVREELGDCRRCGLCQSRTKIVFGVGSERADIVFVGGGPADSDDQQGEPFVGEGGALLTRIITNVLRLDRSEVYLCNVVKCRPPNDRSPEPDEVGACAPFLRKQLAALQPKVVVALGGSALQALLGTDQPVARMRGTAHPFDGAVLVPTHEPAYLLRHPADKRQTMQDMMLVRAEYERATGKALAPVLRRQR